MLLSRYSGKGPASRITSINWSITLLAMFLMHLLTVFLNRYLHILMAASSRNISLHGSYADGKIRFSPIVRGFLRLARLAFWLFLHLALLAFWLFLHLALLAFWLYLYLALLVFWLFLHLALLAFWLF